MTFTPPEHQVMVMTFRQRAGLLLAFYLSGGKKQNKHKDEFVQLSKVVDLVPHETLHQWVKDSFELPPDDFVELYFIGGLIYEQINLNDLTKQKNETRKKKRAITDSHREQFSDIYAGFKTKNRQS